MPSGNPSRGAMDAFEAVVRQQALIAEGAKDPDGRDETLVETRFFVPEAARWSSLAALSEDVRIGVTMDDAMCSIEAENPSIKEASPIVYGKESIDHAMLSGLIDLLSNLKLDGTGHDFDLISHICEYCIGELASSSGKHGGEFHIPESVVNTLIEMIKPARRHRGSSADRPGLDADRPKSNQWSVPGQPSISVFLGRGGDWLIIGSGAGKTVNFLRTANTRLAPSRAKPKNSGSPRMVAS